MEVHLCKVVEGHRVVDLTVSGVLAHLHSGHAVPGGRVGLRRIGNGRTDARDDVGCGVVLLEHDVATGAVGEVPRPPPPAPSA